MKKLLLLSLLLCACNSQVKDYKTFDVNSYTYSYQTSEVQEYTHDCHLAVFTDNENKTCYVEVDYSYNEETINVKKTEKLIWYRVYDIEEKVYNNYWELAL